jgi:hypothetical protein
MAPLFNTIQFCVDNNIPSFTFYMDYDKKVYTSQDKKYHVSWSKINTINYKNHLKQDHNGFAIITGEKYIVIDFDLKHNPPAIIYDTLYANCQAVEKTPGKRVILSIVCKCSTPAP